MHSYSIGKFHTSSKELTDLFTAWIMVSIAFAIVQISGKNLMESLFSTTFLSAILISGITVGAAFIMHELAHKIVAQRYHCWAEFRAEISMLVMAVLMSFLGFVFIAPGAVIIYGHISQKQSGIISLAGPLANIIIATLLLPLLFMETSGFVQQLIVSGYMINAWLALFNMIPLWNFDGAKIYKWSKPAYFALIIISAGLLFIFFMR